MAMMKLLIVIIAAWIGMAWSGAWTALLMTISLSVLCLALAYDQYVDAIMARRENPVPSGNALLQ